MSGSAIEGGGGQTTPPVRRRTRIIATLGRASRDAPMLERLIEAGMDAARINLPHGTTAEHEQNIVEVRGAAARRGSPLAVLIDLPGPKLRLGGLSSPIAVKRGETVDLGQYGDAGCRSTSRSSWRTSRPASWSSSTTAPSPCA
jgi:pyruvate kinase